MMLRSVKWVGRAVAALVGLLLVSSTLAQSANVKPEDEYKQKLRVTEDIQPLGENPFGENISTYNGGEARGVRVII
jgi:hypothetical protein